MRGRAKHRASQTRAGSVGSRAPIPVEAKPTARWSLDFVHDQFACGWRFRIINIVDDVTRECLAAIPDTSIPGKRVVRSSPILRADMALRAGRYTIGVDTFGVVAWEWTLTRSATPATALDHKQNCSGCVRIPRVTRGMRRQLDRSDRRNISPDQRTQVLHFASEFRGHRKRFSRRLRSFR
jgi:hypothetical protein